MTDAATDPSTVVRTFLEKLVELDIEAACALLHPEVEWRNTGLPTLRGTRVFGALRDMGRRGVRFEVELHHVAAEGDVVLTDRTDLLGFGPISSSFWVRGTFELRDGLIVLWDDAFSWGGFAGGAVVGILRGLTGRR